MEDEIFDVNPGIIKCSECSGIMRYKGAGIYACEDCGHEEMNDYGKVRAFLEKRGPSNIIEISAGTGLPRAKVSTLLKDGKLEVAPHSATRLYCLRCGMGIRFGDYCSRCQNEVNLLDERNRKKGTYNALKDIEEDKDSRMRFMDDKKKKK